MAQDMAAENLFGHAGFGGVAPNGKSNGGGSKRPMGHLTANKK
jgi:hypothetical protein